MPDLVENNLKIQKEDALNFLGQEFEKINYIFSNNLIEKIYDVVRKASTDQTVDAKNEIKKLILDEIN